MQDAMHERRHGSASKVLGILALLRDENRAELELKENEQRVAERMAGYYTRAHSRAAEGQFEWRIL
jgi:hypothetical protein